MTNGTIEAFDTFLCVLRGLIDIANLRDPGYAIVPTIDALRDHLREELSSNALDAEGIVQFTSKELARDALLTALQDKELARERAFLQAQFRLTGPTIHTAIEVTPGVPVIGQVGL